MNGLLYILEELKKSSSVQLLITEAVKYEVVDRPIGIPRFELGALRVQELINSKVLELPEDIGISKKQVKTVSRTLMNLANNSAKVKNKSIKIVSEAEMTCLALSKILTEKNIENIIGVDERTTRILSEKPQNLERIMSSKLHKRVEVSPRGLEHFKKFKFIRSTELVYVAYKKGLLKIKNKKALEATIYATKFKGSSISWDEIKVLKTL